MRGRLRSTAAILLAGCDPFIDVEGSFFPAWMLCLLVGIAGTVVARRGFAALDLEAHLGPLPIVYSALALLLTLTTWLVFFRS